MKILVADDNIEFCENVRDIVELEGHEVTMAVDGAEAVRKFREKQPDFVIMDIRMPVMDGVTAFKKIKEISPKIPVVLVTAYAADNVIERAIRGGVVTCLRKPVDFEELLRIIIDRTSGL